MALNNRDPQWHDLYIINIVTGAMVPLLEHNRFGAIWVDDNYRVRFAAEMQPDSSLAIFTLAHNDWLLWDNIPAEDAITTNLLGFDKSGNLLYIKDSRGRDTATLVEITPETKAARILAVDARTDAEDVLIHPIEKHVQAVSFVYERKRWQILDPEIEGDLAYLGQVAEGELEIVNRSLDDRYWVLCYIVDNDAARYYPVRSPRR